MAYKYYILFPCLLITALLSTTPAFADENICQKVCGADRYYPASSLEECSDASQTFLCIQDKKPCFDYLIPRGWQTDSNCCCQDEPIEMPASGRINCQKFVGWDINGFATEKNIFYPYGSSTKDPAECLQPAETTTPPPEEEPPSEKPEENGAKIVEEETSLTTTGACPVFDLDGWFEPAQGVWQDDYKFKDKPNKQISFLLKPWPAYKAELDMVKDRDSLLFGIFRAVGRDNQTERDFITLKGFTTGSKAIKVHYKFSLNDQTLYEDTDREFEILLDGPCFLPQEFKAAIDASNGIPPTEQGPFIFKQAGPYLLTAELVRADGRETGLKMTVEGTVAETLGFKIHFLPATITGPDQPSSPPDLANLLENASRLAEESALFIPDYYPLPPNSLTTVARSLKNLYPSRRALTEEFFELTEGRPFTEQLLSKLNDDLTTSSILGNIDRLVVLISEEGFASFGFNKVAAGFALSPKVIIIKENQSYHTVAHEIAHTLPYLWSSSQMASQCDINYHNLEDRYAFGHQIVEAGEQNRRRQAQKISIMGSEVSASAYWMDQCTYNNLLNQLQKKVDPEIILVRGTLDRSGGTNKGQLHSLYQLDSVADLDTTSQGQWSIRLYDNQGNRLARFQFDPIWKLIVHPEEIERNIISFAYRVPALPNVSQIDLVDPAGIVLDIKKISPNAPLVTILRPDDESPAKVKDGKIKVRWVGEDADIGEKLLYTVFYSPDGGQTWLNQVLETTATDIEIEVDPQGLAHLVKIIVTDGFRSNEDIVSFELSASKPLVTWYVIITLIAVILIVALGYYIYRSKKEKMAETTLPATESPLPKK